MKAAKTSQPKVAVTQAAAKAVGAKVLASPARKSGKPSKPAAQAAPAAPSGRAATPRPGQPVRGSHSGRPIMAALDLLGRRGALRLLWELRGEVPLTFRALQAACDSNPALLNTRLKELREAGLVQHDAGYALTGLGRRLLKALWPLQAWADEWAVEVGC